MSSDTPIEDGLPEPDRIDFKQLNAEITSTLNKTISELFGKMLIDIDNRLFELSKSSEQAEDYDYFFNSMRMLRAERNTMGQRFARSLSIHQKPDQPTSINNPADLIQPSVSEKQRQVIIQLQDKASKQHKASIDKLEGQLLELSTHSNSSINYKAISPQNFCDAYLACISGLDLADGIDDILFELFDTDFISHLDSIYHPVSDLLEKNGIQSGRGQQQTGNPENLNNETADQEDISKIINDFLHGDDEDNQRQSRSAPASKQFYGRDDVIKALTNLQLTYQPQYIDGEKTKVTTDDFTKSLLNSMAKLRPGTSMRSVAAIDAKTIEFVEMVFDAFLDDCNISSVIKNLLLRLQVPIIKIAMLDNKLFQNRSHPGRNLLDKIAHIGIGVEDTENTLYQTLDLIVQQLLQSYDKNIISFQTALNSLNRLQVNETENQSEKEKLTQKKIIQEHARQIVLIELQYHVKNHYIPPQIQPLILKYWATLMLYCYLQHGNDSDEWNESIILLKLLVSSLQPIRDQNEWFCLNNSYQEICQRIEELLLETKQDQSKLTESIESLVQIFTEMLEQSDYKPDEPEFDESAFDTITLEQLTNQITSDAAITPMQAEADHSRKKLTLLPGYVKPGGWYEIFVADDSAKRRLKLSVIIMEEARLIFVDRLGVKVLDKDAETFSQELEDGKSAFLTDDSIFDSALTRVINSLPSKR